MPENWISIKDKLPKFEEIVLFTDGKDTAMGYLHSTVKKGNTYCVVYGDIWERAVERGDSFETTYVRDILESRYIRGVTHWMSLPEPPKEE